MHPNPNTADPKLATVRELLFLGFEESFEQHISNFPYQSNTYQYAIENNTALAFSWLGKRVDTLRNYHLPFAVLCDLDWLINDQYRLAQQMAAHPDLCSVPLIAFAIKGKPANKSAISAYNIDDCYTIPVVWSLLESRLEFINQYKPRILETSNRIEPEDFSFRIPWQKRMFDLIGASMGLVLSAIIWLPVMLAIWIESRGPVVYKSLRVGSGFQVFEFFKFRSMYSGADEQLADVQYLNRYSNNLNTGEPLFVKITGDPRTTRVGRFIRKYSVDELPQLINVLRGDMSLVGNRPLPIYEAETLTNEEWSDRFLGPAGLTGLWQISKRDTPNMNAAERINLDITYSKRKYSVWGDLKIVLLTFLSLVQKGDY